MNKTKKYILDNLQLGTKPEKITNPFSGISCMLEPKGVALYDLIKGAEMLRDSKTFGNAIELFQELYPSEYMDLLD